MTYSTLKKKLSLLGIFCYFVATLSAQVAFQETSFSNAQIVIQEEKLPYIIYFYGDLCPSCQLMEQTTFKDSKVRTRIDENYVVFKVNAASERGKEWMNIYGVTNVPTTLFYSDDHYLLNRLDAPITRSDFLKLTTDLGKLSPKAISKKQVATLPVKNNLTNPPVSKKRIINSSPKEIVEKENLKHTIMALDVEIQALKNLMEAQGVNNLAAATNKELSLAQSTDKLTPKGGNLANISSAYPTAKTLSTQIESCKSLLTGKQNIERLVNILEDYQALLILQKEKVVPPKDNLVSTTYKAPTVASAPSKLTTYEKNYAYNQQIIQYLKLPPPVKRGNQFIVQLGKYKNIRNVERLVQRIQDKYDYPVKIDIQKQGDVPIQLVYIGEFRTKEEAIAANENLKWI